jgi:hypothetical protein
LRGSASQRPRGFRLLIRPEGPDAYGLRLEETNGGPETTPTLVSDLDSKATRRILPSVLEAVRASRLAPSILGPQRRKPVVLEESAGVRLALALLVTGPVSKHGRVDAMAAAVADMSTEEAYYWYAKCMGAAGNRARRALRILLAEE